MVSTSKIRINVVTAKSLNTHSSIILADKTVINAVIFGIFNDVFKQIIIRSYRKKTA